MKNKKILILGGLVLAGLGYFLYSKKKSVSLSTAKNESTSSSTSTDVSSESLPSIAPVIPKPIVDVFLPKPAPVTIPIVVPPVIAPIKKYFDYKYIGYSGCNIQWINRDGSTGTRFVPSGQTSFVYGVLENSGSGCGSWTKM